MTKSKKPSNALIWIIAIIAVLAFLGVVYLIVKDLSPSNLVLTLSGEALSNPPLDGNGNVNPLTYCSLGDHRTCSAAYGATCRRQFGGNYNSYCTSHVGDSVTCECIKDVV